MRILLMAMPDTISALDPLMKVPSLGLCSIAANLEGYETRVADLVFYSRNLRRFIERILNDFQPDVIGLSAMSHQYDSACRVAQICRRVRPQARIILGGYHGTLMSSEIGESPQGDLFDFLVRGEGEITFRSLVDRLGSGSNDFSGITGLSHRKNGAFQHNPEAPLIDLDALRLPDRKSRLTDEAQFLGQPFDCVETSRGCTMNCHFCSIGVMYGRKVRMFTLERVISDLKSVRENGKKGVFFVDDNITLDVPRLKKLCEMIIAEKLDSLSYIMQASVGGIASDPGLALLLKKAGFKWVFLGIESSIPRNLQAMGKQGVLNNTQLAVSSLREQRIGVFGGFIIGHPEDKAEDIRSVYRYALELDIDHPIIQCLTPYPKTKTRQELLNRGLITNAENYSLYNGFTCNVRTEHLTTAQLNKAVFWDGLRLYFNPHYLAKSRFWHFRLSMLPSLLAGNFRYLAGALSGKIFTSRHKW